jgi:signal transduction histidine kinase
MATPLKVLIVEDSEDDALLITDCLRQAGYDPDWRGIETADQLGAALASPEPWELILSDYSMPGFSGLEALRLYRNSGRDIPFILVSGSVGEERAVEAMRAGVQDYIMKDHLQRLGPAVDRELREAASRKERSMTFHENRRLNTELYELHQSMRKEAELLSRSRAELEQVTWAASHDLKEPLRMVTMYSQLLLRGRPPENEDEAEFAGHIREGVDRVTALIDGLLAYSRNLRSPSDTSISAEANAVAREALHTLASMIEDLSGSITIDALPSVRIEHDALFDVFKQLFLNALEYNREGVPPCVHVSASRQNDEVCFAVRDNGIGIKPEHQARIFELFRRLHGAEHPGIGVGLPLCRRLIENYGGRLWLESEPGVGSTFYFTLAAADPVAAN